jgi:alginate O-acetyltransferase complex protein AlgI
MIFSLTSLEFLPFLGLCAVLIYGSRNVTTQKWLLLLFSYLFYLTFGVVGVLVVTSIAFVDFHVARRLSVSEDSESRKRWLWVSLTVNLGALAFFKYSGFLAETAAPALRRLGVHLSEIHTPVLLVGLSYFTFAGISYVLDVYYEKLEPAETLSEYVCYLIYFPKLIAGPIVRAAELLPQMRKGLRISAQDFETGCVYLLVGAVKKLVIADQLAGHVSLILADPQHYNAATLIQGMIGYTVQIYADFSGYSDMAIGCARLMGFRFPQNFLMPYSSVNIAEFWRRWHVTLSTWFRDYVFLPLEVGSRRIQSVHFRASRNILITMLLCGLWHGPSWTFVVWGGLHGTALAVYQVYSGMRRRVSSVKRSALHPATLAARALTLSVVMLGWVVFGSQTLPLAFTYLRRMVTWRTDGTALGSPYILPLAALVVLVHLLVNKDRNLIEELPTFSIGARTLSYASLLVILGCLVPSDTMPFAYVRF